MLDTDIQSMMSIFEKLESLKIKNRNTDVYTPLLEQTLNLKKLYILVPIENFVIKMN